MVLQEPIAVVGFDLMFPGDASTPAGFAELLAQGRSAHGEVPKDRYNVDSFYHPDPSRAGSMSVRTGHFLKEDVSKFDAPFFSFTTTEAACLDPQQRMLLESTYRALENAGISLHDVSGTDTSVFSGAFTHEYRSILLKDLERENLKHAPLGLNAPMLANRISWFFNLKAQSLAVETACSSSLVACHLAAQSLDTKESSMAIVTGCNLIHNPDMTNHLTNLGVLSRDGKSYSFDEKANGYARGEGIAVVILKRVSDAIRDKNTIRGVIRNIGCSQDGKSPGITVPTAEAQASLMNRLYTEAGLDPGLTRYFEAHATGTAVGDPIEMSAIQSVFSKHLSPESPMYVGSVKTNIGHLEGSAGLAGLLKSIYVLESGTIPKNPWYERLNSQIKLDQDLFVVPTTEVLWPGGMPRRVSVNSFGIGGTNAHVILEDARSYLEHHGLEGQHSTASDPLSDVSESNSTLASWEHLSGQRHQLYILSTFDRGVERLADSYVHHLEADSANLEESYLGNLSYTLAAKRTAFPWRAALVADSGDNLLKALKELPDAFRANGKLKLGLVFTGQGSQWSGMGRELLRFTVFRESLEAASQYLGSLGSSWSLIDVLADNSANLDLDDPAFSHPMVTALQIALFDLLHSWSVKVHAVIGHSSGEIAAAYSASAIDRQSAWRIAYHRGALSSTVSSGSMVAVGLGPEEAKAYIESIDPTGNEGPVTIACVNSPKSVTLSGGVEAVGNLSEVLAANGVFSRKLRVVNAYHSPLMEPIADDYRRLIGRITTGPAVDTPQRPKFFSSFKGKEVSMEQLLDPMYWVGNLLNPVEFSNGLQSLIEDTVVSTSTSKNAAMNLLEIGPHSVLKSPIRDILKITPGANDIDYKSMLVRDSPADRTALEAAGWLFCRGHQLDASAIVVGGSVGTTPKMLIDLPSYPFDHSTSYWNESRLSKGYRFRRFPRHDLLGAPIPDWNPSNAIWGHWIRAQENPWVKDHVITGSHLYPAAGMLVMAIEACKQLADPALKLTGFRFKDVSFHTALHISDDTDGLETRFYLRPLWEGTSSQSATWNEFELWSYQNDEWRNHCRGWAQAEFETNHNVVDGGLEQGKFEEACAKLVDNSDKSCLDPLTHDQVYDAFDLAGLGYGPTFRNLSDVSVGASTVAAMTLTSPDLEPVMPFGFTHAHVIHPTTLDSALSASFIALHRGGADGDMKAAVPTSIKEMWIASNQRGTVPLQSMRLSAATKDKGARKFESQLTGIDPESRKPLLTVKGLVCTSIAHGETTRTETSTCYNVDWKPDATLLQQDIALQGLGISDALLDTDESSLYAEKNSLIYAYLKRFIRSHGLGSVDTTKTHYQKYLAWAQRFMLQHENDASQHSQLNLSEKAISALESKLENASAGGRLTVGVGRVLPEILSGQRDPLQVLFTDQLAEGIYHRPYSSGIIGSYIRTLAHKNPQMHILEVGAGTGATTGPVLDALVHEGKPRFARYDFTDLSPSFLAKAEESFQDIAHKMRFTTLNIEEDPVAQDFETGKYDVIIASNVIHATGSIHGTLKNIHRLMKPGGKLILFEVTNLDTYGNFSFGLLPGWWLSTEAYRQTGPLLTVEGWNSHLQDSGYSGVDLCFDDGLAPAEFNVMIGTARPTGAEHREETAEGTPDDSPSVSIIVDERCSLQQRLAKGLAQALYSSHNADVAIEKLGQLSEVSLGRKICIFLPELYESVLANPSEKTFDEIKNMCGSARAVFWIVQGGGWKPTNPTADMVLGFSRTMRMENAARFMTLSLSSLKDIAHATDTIMLLLQQNLLTSEAPDLVDNAFCEEDGLIFIPRLTSGSGLASGKREGAPSMLQGGKLEPEPTVFSANPERALMLEVATPGLLDSMRFVDDDIYNQPLGDGQVEFRIMAAGQNFRHLLHALGQIPNSANGAEAAGIVTRTGPNTPFREGDRVFGCHQRLFGTFARGPHHSLAHMPVHLSFREAAAIPIVFMTAYIALHDYARVRQGETVLVHSAAGGLGQACIQLAQLAGAEVFATVGSLDKCELLMKTYGIPRDHIFSSRDLTFAKGVMRMTGGRGVDIAVNSLSGAALRATWDCIAPFGRFAECGKKDVLSAATLPMHQFLRNVSFRLVDLEMLVMEKAEEAGRLWRHVMELVAERSIKSIQPLHVFPYSRIQDSYKFMQSGKHFGKIILEAQPDDVVMALPSQKSSWSFKPDATYVISGGLGGIGRGVARWMVKRGVRNLVLLSRTGPTRKSGQALVAELKAKGVTVFCPAADVTDASKLKQVLDSMSTNMPPIKGCIQAAMVLKPTLFANMSVKDYKTCVDPKLAGSLNLQEMLPDNMDFFVLLSSFAGLIGEPGEANYAAGNTFQDSLARHLVLRGQKAFAIDLGMMGSIGYVAESNDRAAQLEHIGLDAMRPHELYRILEEVCDPDSPLPSALEAQAVFGVPKFQDPRSLNGRTPLWKRDPIFIHLRPSDDDSTHLNEDCGGNEDMSCRRLLALAESVPAAVEVVIQALAQKIWKILKVDVQVDVSAPLHTYGVDSLVAIELRSWILNEIGAEMTIFELMGSGGLDVLAPIMVKRSVLVSVKTT